MGMPDGAVLLMRAGKTLHEAALSSLGSLAKDHPSGHLPGTQRGELVVST
jgi:hypothetical protein